MSLSFSTVTPPITDCVPKPLPSSSTMKLTALRIINSLKETFQHLANLFKNSRVGSWIQKLWERAFLSKNVSLHSPTKIAATPVTEPSLENVVIEEPKSLDGATIVETETPLQTVSSPAIKPWRLAAMLTCALALLCLAITKNTSL